MTTDVLTLVPSWRLGYLLREARQREGWTLADVAARAESGDVERLAAVERGEVPLGEPELERIVALYAIDPAELVPGRTDLVVDLDRHHLATAGHTQALAGAAPTADEVLASYLSLVYTLRRTRPGGRVPLRQADLDVLARALALAAPDVEHRLVGLMAVPTDLVHERSRFLRARVLVPAAGVLVAVTVAGAIVVSSRSGQADPTPTTTAPATTAQATPPAGTVGTEVQIGGAATQTRNADGTPGPVVVSSDGTDASDVPAGAAGVGDAQTAVREPRRIGHADRPRRLHHSGALSAAGSGTLRGMRDWLVAGAVIEGPDGVLLVQNRRRNGSTDWSPPGWRDRSGRGGHRRPGPGGAGGDRARGARLVRRHLRDRGGRP